MKIPAISRFVFRLLPVILVTLIVGLIVVRVSRATTPAALQFDGVSSYVEVADAASLQLPTDLTVEAWIKPQAAERHRHVVGKKYYELAVDPTPEGFVATWEIRSGGRWYTIQSSPLALDRWYHVAGSYADGTMRLHVDGILVGSEKVGAPIDQSIEPLRIGSTDAAGDFFVGTIDEVRVSKVARYTGDFAVDRAPFLADDHTTGLWHLDEGSGAAIADTSTNANNGVFASTPVWTTDVPFTGPDPDPTLLPTPTIAPPTVAPTLPHEHPTAIAEVPIVTTTAAAPVATMYLPTVMMERPTSRPPSPTVQPPTATPVTPTATPASSAGVRAIPVGALGFSDVGARQVVRSSEDRVFIVAPEIYKPYLRMFRATTPGSPAGFEESDPSRRPTADSSIWAVDAAIDSSDQVHVLYLTEAGAVVYQTFDTTTAMWRSPIEIARSRWPNRNNDIRQGSAGVAIALDRTGVAHAVYGKTDGNVRRLYYNNNAGGRWDHETLIDTQPGRDHSHGTLAFAPDGTLYVAWLVTDGTRGAINMRALRNGAWDAVQVVDDNVFVNQGYSIDQGPSLLVTPDGAVHVAYIGPYEAVAGSPSGYEYGRLRHRFSSDGGASWVADDPPARWTHNPGLATDPAGNLYLFGHREHWQAEYCADMLVIAQPAGQTWGRWRTLADGCYDASVSVKWAQWWWNNPSVLDLIFWTERGPNGESDMNRLQYAEIRGGPAAIGTLPAAE